MSWSALLALLWSVLVSLVALMPYPQHRPYALALLVVMPALLVAIAVEWGALWAAAFFLCALSIYRCPALFLLRPLRRRFGDGE